MRTFVYIFLIISLLLASTLLLCGCSFDGETEMIKHTYSISEDITNVDVLVKKADFSVSITTDDIETAKLDLIYSKKAISDYSVSDGTLSVTAKRNFPWNIFNNEEGKIILTLPKKDYESISINSSSGDIKLSGFDLAGELKLDTASGDINLANVNAASLSVSVSSGDVEINRLMTTGDVSLHAASGDFSLDGIGAKALTISGTSSKIEVNKATLESVDIDTTSGDIELNETYTTDTVKIDTTSGAVDIERSNFAGKLTVETGSGDVHVTSSDAAELDLDTTSGDVTLTLLTPKNFVVETTSGKQDVIGTVYTQPLCKINTTSGDVTVRIAE